ncbi:hypothetical protein C1645_37168 [Glomus cerebriforme]|uniref:Uncharacterized protein n=1 Tax=Glomus cerebriforme TaxID=658196 RepID=A0A397T9F4_9GLOM|nr:hypothetical protein C1645_37168 [Glomus cerebriforme]
MDHIYLPNNDNFNFTETNNVPPEQSSSHISNINYNVDNADFSVMNDDIVHYSDQQLMPNENTVSPSYPTLSYAPHCGHPPQSIEMTNNDSNLPNENIASTSPTNTSSYDPQYGYPPQQPIENTFFPFNVTTINPSHSEILSFDIPGFKVIIIPTSSQQDNNTYLNYPSSAITDNYQTQFTQFQQ